MVKKKAECMSFECGDIRIFAWVVSFHNKLSRCQYYSLNVKPTLDDCVPF